MPSTNGPRRGFTRRDFLAGAAAGLGVGIPATWYAARHLGGDLERLGYRSYAGRTQEVSDPIYAMPGRFPGRVVEVRHPAAVDRNNHIDATTVSSMVDRGMVELVGGDPSDPLSAWRRFFDPACDVVGIKVNPVGRKPQPGEGGRVPGAVGAISNPEVLIKVVSSLRAIGFPPQNIIVFERYAIEFAEAGYEALMRTRPLDGVRWLASSYTGGSLQVDIAGFDNGRDNCPPELARHVVGYDPDHFAVMGFCTPQHSKNDDRRFRSHLSLIVTRLCSKIINLPVLKDHRSAGVTLALKNLSHGMNNNVARSHLADIVHGLQGAGQMVTGPNQCNTFIPRAVAQHALRQKATLHILDGLIGVYEGGPGCWNKTWGTWRHKGLFFATDPVALDHVGWDLIDAKRAQMGWAPVERMGWVNQTPARTVATHLAPFAASDPVSESVLAAGARNLEEGRATEVFNLRQPDHVVLAGQLGLGTFDREQIEHRLIEMAVS
jgi:hypothetical protein